MQQLQLDDVLFDAGFGCEQREIKTYLIAECQMVVATEPLSSVVEDRTSACVDKGSRDALGPRGTPEGQVRSPLCFFEHGHGYLEDRVR